VNLDIKKTNSEIFHNRKSQQKPLLTQKKIKKIF